MDDANRRHHPVDLNNVNRGAFRVDRGVLNLQQHLLLNNCIAVDPGFFLNGTFFHNAYTYINQN